MGGGRARGRPGAAAGGLRLRMTPEAPEELAPGRVRRTLRPVARPLKRALWRARVERDSQRARVRAADVAIFHDFAPPPAGGGHQTLRALVGELERRGVRVEHNAISSTTRAVLF